MPRATLSFDLPAEAVEFRNAIDGGEAIAALQAIDELCRRAAKDAETSWISVNVLKEIREQIPQEVLYPCE